MLKYRTQSDFAYFMDSGDRNAASEYDIANSPSVRLIPFVETTGGEPFLASVYTAELVHKIDPVKRHTVSIVFKPGSGYTAVCGETFLTGVIRGGRDEAERRSEFASFSPLISEPHKKSAILEMQSNFAIYPKDSTCGFWKKINSSPGDFGCKHVESALKFLAPNFKRSIADDLRLKIDSLGASAKGATTAGTETLLSKLQSRSGAAIDKKIPVRLEGPKGGGKTFAVRELAKDFAHTEEVGGFAGMESFDFLGANLPFDGGKLIWMDGPVTAAFRSASSVKTLLFIDEWMQVPRRERGVFLNALTPHEGVYRLRTGRPIVNASGIASMEVITCPVANLAVVVATNSGSDYGLEEDCPALAERFVTIVHTPTDEFIKSVLISATTTKGFAPSAANPLIRFLRNTEKLRQDNLLDQTPSLRLLVRSVEMAPNQDSLKECVIAQFPTFLGRTPEGLVNPVHQEQAMIALTNAFK